MSLSYIYLYYAVLSVINYTVTEGRTGQQVVDFLQKHLEQLGAEKTGNFSIDCETYQSQPPVPSRMVHTLHNSEQPASCFAVLDTGTTLVADLLLDQLMQKMKGFYVPRKNLKVESRGQRYTLGGDFVVKIGSVILGQTTSFKGVLVEVCSNGVEYLPCQIPADCWLVLKEFIIGVLGASHCGLIPSEGPGAQTNTPTSSFTEGFSKHFQTLLDTAQPLGPSDCVLQYLEHFNNFRKAVGQPQSQQQR